MIAKDVLTTLISTVASESAFSAGGRLVCPHGSRFHANTLEALMCIQNWLLKDIKGKQNLIVSYYYFYLFFIK